MDRMLNTSFVVLTAWGLLIFAGCGSKPANGPGKNATQPTAEGHHEGEGHEHGGEHAEKGPHGGHLVELGNEEYHAEIVDEESTGKVTVYLLDKTAKNPALSDQQDLTINLTVEGSPKQFQLAAMPMEGEQAGRSSRFEATNKELVEALDSSDAKGRMNVTLEGKSYVGSIEHHEH